ncbi:hypothetical protein BKA64DRAFT_712838 [Cadophora sp. MPI-SDFR-AT-0126]|nr:hypothetical protein BKA64DRAFT_712838 [Leotiomycetes sp. MPI-SDFR-AT-0126]
MVNYPGFDLTNLEMIRLLAEGLQFYLDGNHRATNNPALGRMGRTQRQTFQQILGQMGRDHQFHGMVNMLIDSRHEGDRVLLRAAQELLRYEQVLDSTDEDESEDDGSQDPGSESEDVDQGGEGPSVKVLEDDGYQVVWDPTTMSDDFARPGVPDPAFYKIVIPLRQETEAGSGIWEDAPSIKFDYLSDHNAPSWESSTTLYKFNQWRNQIFRKYLGNKRRTRDPWLVSEQQRIITLLKQQLEDQRKIRGKPKWNRLANAYNRELHQTIQFKGSRLVQEGVKKVPVTDYDRFAPWRTKGAIQNIIKKGTWKSLIDPILTEAKERRRQYDVQRPDNVVESDDSRDEKELPNPDAPKSKAQVRATNAARKEARKKEASSKKRAEVVVLGSSEEESEDEGEEMDEDED